MNRFCVVSVFGSGSIPTSRIVGRTAIDDDSGFRLSKGLQCPTKAFHVVYVEFLAVVERQLAWAIARFRWVFTEVQLLETLDR